MRCALQALSSESITRSRVVSELVNIARVKMGCKRLDRVNEKLLGRFRVKLDVSEVLLIRTCALVFEYDAGMSLIPHKLHTEARIAFLHNTN